MKDLFTPLTRDERQEESLKAWLQNKGKEIPIDITIEASHPFEEVWEVEAYPTDTLIYLYVFQTEDVTYTFISADKESDFFMYALE